MGFSLLLVNAFLKTAALWIIFLYFSNHLLRRPLNRLTSATQKVNLDNLESFKADINISDKNELKILEESFNTMILNLHQSIRDKEKTEVDLKEAHSRFLTVLNSIDATIYVADMETYEILFMNQYMINVFGRDMTGEICWKVFRGESEPCSHCNNENLADENGEPSGVFVWQDQNPITGKWYLKYDRAIKWTDGRLVKLQIATDTTKQRQLEEELRQAQKMESIGTLAGGVAHDFNNILYAIIGNAEIALEDLPKSNPSRTNVEAIKKAAFRASEVVSQLLNFSRKKEVDRHPIDVIPIIKEALTFLRSTIPTTISLNSHLPNEKKMILGDATQINQIIMNLCTNAYQAMEDSIGKIEITAKTINIKPADLKNYSDFEPGRFLQIDVVDTGPGIDNEDLLKIFDPYFTTKEVGKGSGLGLSIVHGIVTNHKGNIQVKSKKGVGTTFTVLLPLIEEKSETKASEIVETPGGREKILFVDDEKSILDMNVNILKKLGYQVKATLSSMDAYKAFESAPNAFDLVITDMTLPEMTGVELSQRIMKIRPDIPIIICTGHSSNINKEKAKQLGLSAYLEKPISMAELSNTIRSILD